MPVVQLNNQKAENCASFERPLYAPPEAPPAGEPPPAHARPRSPMFMRSAVARTLPVAPYPEVQQRAIRQAPALDRRLKSCP